MKSDNNKVSGSSEILNVLKERKISEVFVYPGGTIAPILDLLKKNKIKMFVSRHEQGAGYAALASSKIKRQPQIVLVSSGPGVTNVITPIADAYYDSIPLIIFTGQVGQKDMKKNLKIRQKGFQETDTLGLFNSITKKTFQPKNINSVYDIVNKAFKIASSGRPGPVLIDMPMNIQRDFMDIKNRKKKNRKKNKVKIKISNKIIYNLAKRINASKKPLILCGQGVSISKSEKILRKIAIKNNIPVTMSLLSLGCFPTKNNLSLGFHGHTGNQAAGMAIQNCDLLLIIGSRLDIRQVGTEVNKFAANAYKIRIDIDNDEIKHSRIKCNLNILGNLNQILIDLEKKINRKTLKNNNWINQIKIYKKKYSLFYKKKGLLKPQEIIEKVDKLTSKKKVVCVSGVGQHQQWTARHFNFDHPKRLWFTSGGHGAMGYDLPVAIGAQFIQKNCLVLCFVGDGSFQMNMQELASIKVYKLPVKIIVLDNNRLGIVSQFQKINWKDDPACGEKWNPSFENIAKNYGIYSQTISKREDLDKKIKKFLNYRGSALLHCLVDGKEELSPMLLAGETLDNMWSNEKK